MNIPNILTLFRIAMVPVIVLTFYLPVPWNHTFAAIIFAIAGWTDWFDGYIARRYKMTSSLGAFLDPVADKLMVATALVLIVAYYQTPYLTVPAMIMIGREITVSALREWMAEVGERESVKVDFVGKAKTTGQLSAIFFLLLGKVDITFIYLGYFSLYMAMLLTLWSMVIYLKASWPHFKN